MNNLQEQISILIQIQVVETDIVQACRQISVLTADAAALDQQVAEHEVRLTDEKQALEHMRKSYRDLEAESKINDELVVKSNEKLRAVKTNKEYQSTLKEIEEHHKKNSGIEDRMLDLLETIESAELAVKEKAAVLAEGVQLSREKKETLIKKAQHERKVVEELKAKEAGIRAKANSKIITVLEDVKKKVRGLAVVPVQKAICMGCHMNIPPQLFNELQRFDELRFCPHCHRIIFWKENDNV
jgi:predicted  nucleic acid-binding Zn-ribbon protein